MEEMWPGLQNLEIMAPPQSGNMNPEYSTRHFDIERGVEKETISPLSIGDAGLAAHHVTLQPCSVNISEN